MALLAQDHATEEIGLSCPRRPHAIRLIRHTRTFYLDRMRQRDGTIRKRRKAYDLPGHVHYLTFSCHRGLPLLSSDAARRDMIDALERARRRLDFSLLA